jgi:transposase
VCRLLQVLAEDMERQSFRLGWSRFRRRHQASAQRSHQARRARTDPLSRGTSVILPHTTEALYCTDVHWLRIVPLLPPLGHYRFKRATPHRLALEGLLWAMRQGVPWTAVPPAFGTRKTLGHRYNDWCAAGIWPAILAILRQRALPLPNTTQMQVGL